MGMFDALQHSSTEAAKLVWLPRGAKMRSQTTQSAPFSKPHFELVYSERSEKHQIVGIRLWAHQTLQSEILCSDCQPVGIANVLAHLAILVVLLVGTMCAPRRRIMEGSPPGNRQPGICGQPRTAEIATVGKALR